MTDRCHEKLEKLDLKLRRLEDKFQGILDKGSYTRHMLTISTVAEAVLKLNQMVLERLLCCIVTSWLQERSWITSNLKLNLELKQTSRVKGLNTSENSSFYGEASPSWEACDSVKWEPTLWEQNEHLRVQVHSEFAACGMGDRSSCAQLAACGFT
jgi:hypothetical protein